MSFLLSKAYLLFSGRMKSSFMLCSFKIFVTWSQPVFRYLWFHYNLSPCSKSLWVYSNVSRFLFFLSFLLLPSFLHSTDSNAKTFPCSLNLCCVLPLNKISVTKNLLKYSTTFLFFFLSFLFQKSPGTQKCEIMFSLINKLVFTNHSGVGFMSFLLLSGWMASSTQWAWV